MMKITYICISLYFLIFTGCATRPSSKGDREVQEPPRIIYSTAVSSDSPSFSEEYLLSNSSYDSLPFPIKKVAPIYHEMAMRAGVEGSVTFAILVGKNGIPVKILPLRSVAEIFTYTTTEALNNWVFSQAIKNGSPEQFWATMTFRFTRSGGKFHVIMPE